MRPNHWISRARHTLIAVAAIVASLVPAAPRASLQDQLDDMFNSLTNVTAPTSHMGMRRGALTGGNVFVRNRIMTPNIMSASLPGFSAGCGGIDLYGGSFSFINSDEFEQLLRSIAANASGLLFKMAIDQIAPDLGANLADFQNRLQKLTQGLKNSCQMAKGIISDGKNALQGKQLTESGLIAQFSGGVSDAFEGLWPQDGDSPSKKASDADPAKTNEAIEGNIVWRALSPNYQNAISWFGHGDREMMEAIMSYTGSIIIPPLAAGQTDYKPVPLPHTTITLRTLVFGETVSLYNCSADTSKCEQPIPTYHDVAIDGFQTRISALLNDPGGLIEKYATNVGAISNDEKGFLNVSGGLGAMVRNLTIRDRGLARQFVMNASPSIAIIYTSELITAMLDAVTAAVFVETKAWTEEVRDLLREARTRLSREQSVLAAEYGSIQDTYTLYLQMARAAKEKRYITGSSAAGNN